MESVCLAHLVQPTDLDVARHSSESVGKISFKGILLVVHHQLVSIWTLKGYKLQVFLNYFAGILAKTLIL